MYASVYGESVDSLPDPWPLDPSRACSSIPGRKFDNALEAVDDFLRPLTVKIPFIKCHSPRYPLPQQRKRDGWLQRTSRKMSLEQEDRR